MKKQLIIIGGGPAGLSSAIKAYKNGITDILIIERDDRLGGILNQCIHNGFGLGKFKKSLSGGEYAQRLVDDVEKLGIEYLLDSTVLSINENKDVRVVNSLGITTYKAEAIVLAMGCRERSRGSVMTTGSRASGIFSAGTAQKYINMSGFNVGKRAIIIGSGDIGLIMARRIVLEGGTVEGMYEIMPKAGGLKRNIAQCLNDFNIPLYLSHTIVSIDGDDRVSGATVAKVDDKFNIIPNTERHIECDTILYSVGLIPENELTVKAGIVMDSKTRGAKVDSNYMSSVDGIFACGNVLHVHDLADNVSLEAEKVADRVAEYLSGNLAKGTELTFNTEKSDDKGGDMVCIGCPRGCNLTVSKNGGEIIVEGNACKKGYEYAVSELTLPKRMLTTTVRCADGQMVSVRTDKEIDKTLMFKAMEIINNTHPQSPIKVNDIIIKDILSTGSNVIATNVSHDINNI